MSAASGWEITTKVRTGRWPAAVPLAQTFRPAIAGQGFLELAITVEHACLSGSMAGAHGDPFDRMLAAQSRTENIPWYQSMPGSISLRYQESGKKPAGFR